MMEKGCNGRGSAKIQLLVARYTAATSWEGFINSSRGSWPDSAIGGSVSVSGASDTILMQCATSCSRSPWCKAALILWDATTKTLMEHVRTVRAVSNDKWIQTLRTISEIQDHQLFIKSLLCSAWEEGKSEVNLCFLLFKCTCTCVHAVGTMRTDVIISWANESNFPFKALLQKVHFLLNWLCYLPSLACCWKSPSHRI